MGSRGTRGSSDQDPWILSRFVYMYRPLTGALNGSSGCLFLGGGADVEGAGEYAGGSSPGTEGGDE